MAIFPSGTVTTTKLVTWDRLGSTSTGIGLGASAIGYTGGVNLSSAVNGRQAIKNQCLSCQNTCGVISTQNSKCQSISLGGWRTSTTAPISDTPYISVYESSSNYNVGSTSAVMYINFVGRTSYTLYIRSNGEANYDYMMVSNLDTNIGATATYSTSGVKAHTYGKSVSGTNLLDYTKVEYTNITPAPHTIMVVYRKDGSVNTGADRGYVALDNSNYQTTSCVTGDNIYVATKKRIRVTVTSKRSVSTAIDVDTLQFFVHRNGTKLKTYSLSSGSVSKDSTITRYVDLDWDESWYDDPTVCVGGYVGDFSVSFKAWVGVGSASTTNNSSYIGDAKKHTANGTVTYKNMWDFYSYWYWVLGDNGSGYYYTTKYTSTYPIYMNVQGATMDGLKLTASQTI